MTQARTIRPFTGWHMTAILVGFFAIVITVNVTMATFASSTFGGTVVDNSYVASQNYNAMLGRAAAQDRLGWDTEVSVDAARHVRLITRKQGVVLPLDGITATLSHPLGRVPATTVRFVPDGAGGMRSVEALAPGRWRLEAAVRHGQDEARYRRDVQ